MKEKSILVISDLHVGDGSKRDNFHTEGFNEVFLNLLNEKLYLESELIVLGDFFEFWQASFGDVIIKNLPLLDILAKKRPIIVVGNHDVDLQPLINIPFFVHPFFENLSGPFTREIGGKKFYFSHGHEGDPFNRGTKPSIGRIAAILAGYLEDRFGPMITDNLTTEDWINTIVDGIKMSAEGLYENIKEKVKRFFDDSVKKETSPAQVKDQLNNHFEQMIIEREKMSFDCAVLGHTHVPGKFKNWYFNSGSWVVKRNGKPMGDLVLIEPTGAIQNLTYDGRNFDYLNAEFVWDAEEKKIKNLDYQNFALLPTSSDVDSCFPEGFFVT